MNAVTRMVCPSATTQIRVDHAHVLTTFHQYAADADAATKRVLVNTVCRALQIHAQLEEEIFYPQCMRWIPRWSRRTFRSTTR